MKNFKINYSWYLSFQLQYTWSTTLTADIHILADRNLAALHTENHPLCFHWRFHKGPRCRPSTVHPLEGTASVLVCRRGSVTQSGSSLAEIQRTVSVFQITLGSKKRNCWKAKETWLKFTFCFLSFHWFISLLHKFLPIKVLFSSKHWFLMKGYTDSNIRNKARNLWDSPHWFKTHWEFTVISTNVN